MFSVAAFGDGCVAVGLYVSDGRLSPGVWTSLDGHGWDRPKLHDGPMLEAVAANDETVTAMTRGGEVLVGRS